MTATSTVVTLHAPDISCAHCVATVTKAASAVDGVEAVEASTDTQHVTVTFDPSTTSEADIRAALDEAGYPTKP